MMTENLTVWNALKRPPKTALRTIGFGALKGKSDIDPMWRVYAMTEQFGPCGVGWKFGIEKVWCEPAPKEQMFAFAKVLVYTWQEKNKCWSEPVPGIGGNMLVQLAKGEPKDNDEGYKMAVTDALGTALKMLGVAADIYMGKFDGSKYIDENESPEYVTGYQLDKIVALHDEVVTMPENFLRAAGVESLDKIPVGKADFVVGLLKAKRASTQRSPGEEG